MLKSAPAKGEAGFSSSNMSRRIVEIKTLKIEWEPFKHALHLSNWTLVMGFKKLMLSTLGSYFFPITSSQ